MRIHFKLLLFIAFISIGKVQAQQVKATASLDSSRILIGDQAKLFLQIDYPKDVKVSFPELPDTIGNRIEVLKRSGIDTIQMDNKKFLKQIQAYTITCFDSGSYRIPPYWFRVNVDGHIDSIPSNAVTLNVFTMKIDSTKGPCDIKMPYGAPLTLKEVSPYMLGVILLGAIIFFLLYSIKRKKRNLPIFSKPQKPKEPAHIVVLRELDRIKQEKIWQQGKTKQYYSELTDALRIYLEDRFEVQTMEKVTDEILESIRYRKGLLSQKSFNNLAQILQLADLVKFAKYKPLPDDDNLALVNAYFFVNDTKKEEPKKVDESEGKKGDNDDEIVEEVEIK